MAKYLIFGRRSVVIGKTAGDKPEFELLDTAKVSIGNADEEDDIVDKKWTEWMYENAPDLRKKGFLYFTIVKVVSDSRIERPRTWHPKVTD